MNVSAPAHLCLVDVIQVPHPTGVKLAPSRGEGPRFLEKQINTGGIKQVPPGGRGQRQCQACGSQAQGLKDQGQHQLEPPRQNSRRETPRSLQSSWAAASRRPDSRKSHGRIPRAMQAWPTHILHQSTRAAEGRQVLGLLKGIPAPHTTGVRLLHRFIKKIVSSTRKMAGRISD